MPTSIPHTINLIPDGDLLAEMDDADFAEFQDLSTKLYGADLARSAQMSPEAAMQFAREKIATILPYGRQTQDHFFFNVLEGDRRVGHFWVAHMGDLDAIFVFDVYIEPEYRSRGFGSRLFGWLESECRRIEIPKISLHVFGHNPRALSLYQKLGFEITDLNLTKRLS